eukprot:13460744-Heterocapsa_arctica.AAC.1
MFDVTKKNDKALKPAVMASAASAGARRSRTGPRDEEAPRATARTSALRTTGTSTKSTARTTTAAATRSST